MNGDAPRCPAAFEILSDMAQERQLFVFTCHSYFARETADHLDAEPLDLTALRMDGGDATPTVHVKDPNSKNADISH